MRVLVLGAGAREHALAWRISQSRTVSAVGVAPGNALIALDHDTMLCDLQSAKDCVRVAKNYQADFVVVGPEVPLCAGAVDALQKAGVPALGPTKAQAELEASKAFSKALMVQGGVPTAKHAIFTNANDAKAYVRQNPKAVVCKADGLMAGKGVIVANDTPQAERAIDALLANAKKIVIEEKLPGPELSLIALCDGKQAALFSLSRDYKRVGSGDTGGNTGGMGAFCPLPRRDAQALSDKTIAPILRAFRERNTPYRGFLYAGLMFSGMEPYVLEYNVRLGDPEAQALLVAQQDDVLPALYGAAHGHIEDFPRACGAAVCVVLASRGYPDKPELGARITGVGEAKKHAGVQIFGAGVQRDGGGLAVAGGRVLSVVGHAGTVKEARARAYAAAAEINYDTRIFRDDIALGAGLERA